MISFLYFTKVFLKSKFLIFARYTFSVLEGSGWNFRHAYYHELHRRTLFKVGVLVFLYFCMFVTCFSPQENTCLTFGKSVGRINLSMILFHVGPKTKCKYQQYPL